MTIRHAMATTLAAGLLAGAAQAAPCTQADLAGTWRLAEVTAADPQVAAWHRAHPMEYLRFDAEGAYAVTAGTDSLDSLAAANARLDAAPGSQGQMGIVMNDTGVLILMRNGEAFEGYVCAIEDGAMVWTEREGNPAIRRVQTRVG